MLPRVLEVALSPAIAIAALGIGYLRLGAWPVVPVENDSVRIARGVQTMSLYGERTYAYFYDGQAGTHELAAILVRLGLEPFGSLSLLTVASSLALLVASTVFVHRIAGASLLGGC